MATRRYEKAEQSPVVAELFSILNADDGVRAVPSLELPLLKAHPFFLRYIRPSETNAVVRGFTRALTEAIRQTARRDMRQALMWQFGISPGATEQGAQERRADASKLAGVETYAKTRRVSGRQTPSYLHRALVAIESYMGYPTGVPKLAPPISLEIPGIVPVVTCGHGPTVRDLARFEFAAEVEPDARPTNAQPGLVETMKAAVKRRSVGHTTLNDIEIITLTGAEIAEEPHDDSIRAVYRLNAGASRYLTWAATANALDLNLDAILKDDRALSRAVREPSLRHHWNVEPPQTLVDLAALPVPVMIGVCVVPVIEDHVLLFARQQQYVASQKSEGLGDDDPAMMHVLGEGMERSDLDQTGRLSPDATAARAISEELRQAPDDFEITPTAVVIDQQRCQPVFCYVANYRGAQDKDAVKAGAVNWWEHAGHVESLNLSSEDATLRALLAGQDDEMRLASNHAHAAILYALYWREGFDRVRAAAKYMRIDKTQ